MISAICCWSGAFVAGQDDRDRGGDAGLFQQRLRAVEVARRWLHARHVERRGRRVGLSRRREEPVVNDLVQRVAVERELEGLPHQPVLADRGVGGCAVGEIDVDAVVAQALADRELQVGIALRGGDIRWQDLLGEVDAAGLQVRHPDRGVRQGAVHDAIEMVVGLSQYRGKRFNTMLSWATRLSNSYGPAQTGCAPKLAPAASAALGETIIPARSASMLKSGANGPFSTSGPSADRSPRPRRSRSPRRRACCLLA